MPLSPRTLEQVRALSSTESAREASDLLENDCADNLPFSEDADAHGLERVRAAALKISGGSLSGLVDAIALAQTDWRDLLVSAGFADDITAHERWKPTS